MQMPVLIGWFEFEEAVARISQIISFRTPLARFQSPGRLFACE
jgi:hypothetical protein